MNSLLMGCDSHRNDSQWTVSENHGRSRDEYKIHLQVGERVEDDDVKYVDPDPSSCCPQRLLPNGCSTY